MLIFDFRSLLQLVVGAALILAAAFVLLSGELSALGSGSSWFEIATSQLPNVPEIGALV